MRTFLIAFSLLFAGAASAQTLTPVPIPQLPLATHIGPNDIFPFDQLNPGGGSTFTTKHVPASLFTSLFPLAGVNPIMFGAIGDGQADDTSAVQAAINAASASGVPLIFDGVHLYNVTSLNIINPIDIEGAWRFGFWMTTPDNHRYCPWGLTSTSNLNIINASAVTGTIRNLCIQAGPNTGTGVSASAGAAINLAPPSLATYQTGWHIEGNTLLNVYDGIAMNGVGYASGCCGLASIADGVTVWRNTIVNPVDAGISIGKNTAGARTVGITVTDNAIGCINAASKATGYGVVLYDGSIWYDGTQNGPEGCNIGVAVIPGTVSGHGQKAQIDVRGVVGDQSQTHELLLQPSTTLGAIASSEFDNGWGSGTSATDNEVLISLANGGSIQGLTFVGGTYHSASNQSVPVFDIEGGAGNAIQDIILNGVNIDCWNTGTCSASGLIINSLSAGDIQHVTVTGNRIGRAGGVFTTAVTINTDPGAADITVSGNTINASTTGISLTTPVAGNASSVNISGNSLYGATTPIAYTPNPLDVVVIENNIGVDNACPSAAVAANSVTLPNAYNCIVLTTGGTPNVTNLGPPWVGRQVTLQDAASGFTMSFDGAATYPICKSVTAAQSQLVTLLWHALGTCWTPSL